jgi:hypothetical protein
VLNPPQGMAANLSASKEKTKLVRIGAKTMSRASQM